MALLFLESFDKYGLPNTNSTIVGSMLTAGEWTSTGGASWSIAAGLSSTGYALGLGSASSVNKTLAGNYSRLIGGVRFSSTLAAAAGVQFFDTATPQASIVINAAGTIGVRTGGLAGTLLATSTASISANSTHHLEWDITFANAGSFTVYLDGVAVIGGSSGITGSGDTTGTANNYANVLSLTTAASGAVVFDDFYLFDTTGSANNAALLTSPRIETTFPTGDSTVQFAAGAAILGTSVSRSGALSTGANQLRLRAVVPAVACTLNSVSFLPNLASSTINLRPVVYANSGSVPGALLGSGATVTATTASTAKTMPLTTGVALSAGTTYWIGWMCDIFVSNGLAGLSTANDDFTTTSTFASGAPGTAPAMTAATNTVIWGNVTLSGTNNWYEVSQNPPQGAQSYLFDATVGHEDLYLLPNLSATPSTVHAVAVKANCSRSDSGARTVSLRMSSSGTDSGGSATGQTPGTSYGWLTSLFPTNPATGSAWLPNNVNAALVGFKIDA